MKQAETCPPLFLRDDRSGVTLSLLLNLVLSLCCDWQQTGVDVSGKPLIPPPLEKCFTVEVAK